MAGYSRVYNKQSGDVILAEEFVTEFGSIDAAFDETTGHSHSGATGEGAPISIIGNAALTTKVEIDSANNEVEFHVSGAEQIKITDGAILPITDNDIDLGAVGAEFKNLYIDGTANIDSLVADTADINGGTVDGVTIGGASAGAGTFTNLTVTGTISFPENSIQAADIGAGALPTDVTINNANWSGTDLAVANGGTGASTEAGARTALGLAIGSDVQAYSTHLAALVSIAKTDGNIIVGNGTTWVAESGATARASLGLTIGSDVQAYDADLATIAGLAKTDGNFIVGNGTAWTVESGATARTSLGLGSIATQNSNSVSITGGSISGLTSLVVDNITINGATISSNTGAISFSNESLSTTGSLSCATFTSSGIDDNATAEMLEISNYSVQIGQNGTHADGALLSIAGDIDPSPFTTYGIHSQVIFPAASNEMYEIRVGGYSASANVNGKYTGLYIRGFEALDSGATTLGEAIGVDILSFFGSLTPTEQVYGIRLGLQENAGTVSTYNLYIGGTAPNYIQGYTSLGGDVGIKTKLYTGTLGAVSTTTTVTTGLTADQIISVTTLAQDDLGNWVVNGSWNEAGLKNWNIRTTVQSDGTIDLSLDSTSSELDGNSYKVFVVYKSA